jgi:glycosyltransferase involved in cell wall biosynthesis
VEFLGEADYRLKRELYAKASVALMPICWEEPFGLVMIEAMACGTPVIAFARGAAPEIVADGETGFLVQDTDSMVSALERVEGISPARCRRHVEKHFDVTVMVAGYLRMYSEILESKATVDAAPTPPPTLEPFPRQGETAGTAMV